MDVAEKMGAEPEQKGLRMQMTPFEERAVIDGKIFFLVLARADINYNIESLIKEEKWEELIELISQNMT